MGRLDYEKLTLREFIDPYISIASRIRVVTGCVSAGPLKWLLTRLSPTSTLSVIAGSIPPDFQEELDMVFGTSSLKEGIIGRAVTSGRFRLGFYPEIHVKVWLLTLRDGNRPPCLTVSGGGNLTWSGLERRKGVQNYYFTDSEQFFLEDSRWKLFVPETRWLTESNWAGVRKQCWKDSAQPAPCIWPGFEQEKSIQEIQIAVAEFSDMSIEHLKSFGERHPLTVIYAYEQIKGHLSSRRMEGKTETIH